MYCGHIHPQILPTAPRLLKMYQRISLQTLYPSILIHWVLLNVSHGYMGNLPVASILKKTLCPSLSIYDLPISLRKGWVHKSLHPPCWKFLIGLILYKSHRSNHSSCNFRMKKSWHTQRTALHSILPLLWLIFFLYSLRRWYQNLGREDWCVYLQLYLGTHSCLLSIIWSVMNLSIDLCPLQYKASFTMVEGSTDSWI